MLFRLDQTSPKAWLYHLPSLWASWMIHTGPWDWEWAADHVMETLLQMQSWRALTCMCSWAEGVAEPLTLLEDAAFPAKTLKASARCHFNVIFLLLFLGTSHLRNWSADQANSLHLHTQARRQMLALWWVYECWQARQEWVWCNRELWSYLLHKFLSAQLLLSKFLNFENLRLSVQFINRSVNVNLNLLSAFSYS